MAQLTIPEEAATQELCKACTKPCSGNYSTSRDTGNFSGKGIRYDGSRSDRPQQLRDRLDCLDLKEIAIAFS